MRASSLSFLLAAPAALLATACLTGDDVDPPELGEVEAQACRAGGDCGPPLPETPTFEVGATDTSTTTARITWNETVRNETGHELWRRLTSSFLCPAPGELGVWQRVGTYPAGTGARTVDDSGLRPHSTYTYEVRLNRASGGPLTRSAAVQTAPASAPTYLSAVAAQRSLRISWPDAVIKESRFVLSRRWGNGWEEVGQAPGSDLATCQVFDVQVDNLRADREYCFQLAAETPLAGRVVLEERCFRTEYGPPEKPIVNGEDVTTSSIDVVWTDYAHNEDRYQVERRLGQGGPWTVVHERGAVAGNAYKASFLDTGLTPGTEYCYQVTAFNSAGPSVSNVTCRTTLTPGTGGGGGGGGGGGDGGDGGAGLTQVCGIGTCPVGTHDFDYVHSNSCQGGAKNATRCQADSNDFLQCSIGGCPNGWHPAEFSQSLGCELSAPGNNRTRCVRNGSAGFWQCGFGCPSGFTQTQSMPSLSCSPSSGGQGTQVFCSPS